MTIINIEDFLGKPKSVKCDTYKIEVVVNRKDPSDFEYFIEPENLVDTLDGVRFVMYHLSEIAVDLCYGMDPALIVQLQELLMDEE